MDIADSHGAKSTFNNVYVQIGLVEYFRILGGLVGTLSPFKCNRIERDISNSVAISGWGPMWNPTEHFAKLSPEQ